MVKIRVTYDGFDIVRDKGIRGAMEYIGATFYAQGFDLEAKKRDVCFDMEESKLLFFTGTKNLRSAGGELRREDNGHS